ncbi:MAG: hypothetical protein LBJ63_10460 [Prevotellaceae bacterium]|jgi:hypothetical protein|nr:hypothetical protein [Prevotellaceae bacterium]
MSKSVSNDALWERLSEIDKKLEQLLKSQKTEEPMHEKGDLREKMITEIKNEIHKFRQSNESHLDVNRQNVHRMNGNIMEIFKHVCVTMKLLDELIDVVQAVKEDKKTFFNFRFFKVRKTSFAIAILGLLTFILTLFCMKQQNDYSLLMDEYYRQGITIRELGGELKIYEEKQRR